MITPPHSGEPGGRCSCGQDHQHCGHAITSRGVCHVSALMPCPNHFLELSSDALCASLPGGGAAGEMSFVQALMHLNDDGYILSAWHTWMALLGRWAVPEGADRDEALKGLEPGWDDAPADAPEYLLKAMPLVKYATRAALLGDAETLDATFAASHELLEDQATVCFLKSCAASAHIAAESNDACTTAHLAAFQVLGSQMASGLGVVLLPLLVDMVVAHSKNDVPGATVAFNRILEMEGAHPLVTCVDILARTLAQITTPDSTVIYGNKGVMDGVVDIDAASPENTPEGVMAGVWTVRAARAYSGAATREEATARIRDLVREHGQPGVFAMDVTLYGSQMVAYAMRDTYATG